MRPENPSDDRQLVERMCKGDAAAFDAYFKEFFPRLYRFVLPRVGSDPQAAEDICQDVMVRAMRRIDTYRGEASLFTWNCQIARNVITDYWRARKRRDEVEVLVEDDADIRAALESLELDIAQRPDEQQSRLEVLRLVEVALDRLPGAYGNALEWKYIDGLSVAEIAERLDQSVLATQSMLARARNAFREAFSILTGVEAERIAARTDLT
jgi:RNA polymerase sigma-70 factor, ECF subfamily